MTHHMHNYAYDGVMAMMSVEPFTAQVPWVGLGLYVVGLATTLGARTWSHWRSTGATGFHGVSGRLGSLAWWGGVIFPVALLLGLVGLIRAAVDPGRGLSWPPHPVMAVTGFLLAVGGLALTVIAQTGMGASWRIGVDESERTTLVTTGVFAWVRNPVFTGMATVSLGIALMVPTVLTVSSFVCLVLAVQIQVRVVEEPYLARVHGTDYAGYLVRTGRFLPGVGRRRATSSGVDTRGA